MFLRSIENLNRLCLCVCLRVCECLCAFVRVLFFLSGPQNGTEEVQNGGVAESKGLGGDCSVLLLPGAIHDQEEEMTSREQMFCGDCFREIHFFCFVRFLGKEYGKLRDVRVVS